MKSEEKIYLLSGQFMASAGLFLWCFPNDHDLLYTTCPQSRNFLDLLRFEDCVMRLTADNSGMTAWFSNSLGMNWLGDSFVSEAGLRLNIIIGPFFFQQTSEQAVRERMRDNQMPLELVQSFVRLLPYIPVIDSHVISYFASMLHFTCGHSGAITSLQSLTNLSSAAPKTNFPAGGPESLREAGENEYDNQHILKEKAYLSAIRNGDLTFVSSEQIGVFGQLADYGLRNNLRSAKNNVIGFSTLASRAAVEGGLPWNVARKIEHEYIGKIEKAGQITTLAQVMQAMVQDFSERVRKVRQTPHISPEMLSVCEYLQQNYMHDISLEQIAAKFGYEKYYLSRKFTAQVGAKLTDYLRSIRLNHAKLYLASTELSIEDISYKVCFSTRSYFNRCFREEFGVTPQEFRQQYLG